MGRVRHLGKQEPNVRVSSLVYGESVGLAVGEEAVVHDPVALVAQLPILETPFRPSPGVVSTPQCYPLLGKKFS